MKNAVGFRLFEERDIDFIYRCKNDDSLNSLTVGQNHPFSYQEAVDWVKGVIRADRKDMKFWAVCTNDDKKRIVGWISLSHIDYSNKSACSHGIFIGDQQYRDGNAWIECALFLYRYVFESLNFNRIYGSYLEDHLASRCLALALYESVEGVARQAVFKNGKFNNVIYSSLLKEEYEFHMKGNDYDILKIIHRIVKISKDIKIQKNKV